MMPDGIVIVSYKFSTEHFALSLFNRVLTHLNMPVLSSPCSEALFRAFSYNASIQPQDNRTTTPIWPFDPLVGREPL